MENQSQNPTKPVPIEAIDTDGSIIKVYSSVADAEIARLNSLAVEVDIDSITIGQRVRRNFDHVPSLAESIKEEGLIQPIVLTYDRKLIAGESRIRAHRLLGLKTIRAVFRGVLDEAQLGVLEATENNARQDLTWQERILSVDKVHRIRATTSALSGESWSLRETGKLLNQAKSKVALATYLAEYLHKNDQAVWKADSAQDAYRILCKRREDEVNALIAKSTIPTPKPVAKYTGPTEVKIPSVTDADFLSTPSVPFTPGISGPTDDDELPGQVPTSGPTEVPLSRMLLKEDSEDTLNRIKEIPDSTQDACITDWPYAIDMDHLNANNVHGGLRNLDSVIKEHDVDKNKNLQSRIIPEIYRVLKPNSFFITWMDIMTWQETYDACVAAGFKVQRWPLIWLKTSPSMNQSAQFNFTKNYEIAIVCRKGNATILTPQASSVWTGSNDTEAKALGHPFAKPFGLWDWVYTATCKRGDNVLEPFAGRGSALIPAIRRGLKITAIECNQQHYDSLVVNISNVYRSLDPNCKFV